MAGLLGFPTAQPQIAGLLGQYYNPADMRKQMLWNALTQAGMGLLSQGPSKTPIGFGDTLAAGFKGGIEGAQAGQQNYMQQGLLAKQMADAEADRQRQLKADARLNTEFGWKVDEHGRQEDSYAAQQRWLQSLPPEQRAIAEGNPDAYYQQYLQTQFPKANEGFTLGEGQTRYDAQGKPIVTAPNPQVGPGGDLFDSKSVESRSLNYLIQIGKLTKEQAAQIGAGKAITGADGSALFITPTQIIDAAKQAGMPMDGTGQQQPNQTAQPAPMMGGDYGQQTARVEQQMPQAMPGQRQQFGIPFGPAKKTESQIKGEAILSGAQGAFVPAIKYFDALKNKSSAIAGRYLPEDAARWVQSDEYQIAYDAIKNITQGFIYALSGQQAPEQEVARRAALVVPGPFDKPRAIAMKKRYVQDMIDTVKARAAGPGDSSMQTRQLEDVPNFDALDESPVPSPGAVVKQADIPENTIVEDHTGKLFIKRAGRMVPYTGPLPGQ